jgi:thioredoxin 1
VAVKELTTEEFESFIKKGKSVVDFWAEWCGPCKIMTPHFKKASEEIKEIKFGKVDVDKEFDLSGKYKVMSIPTTIFFQDGDIVDKHTGAMTADQIDKKIKEAFS